ncbi:hypothetical protein [Paenibacillus sp. 481]|uniref:hypothetical protein n=1 Tax=Paenibacillus sp. 481 TaxID=2835869 RepID=UPI001E4AE3A1|nr:hypothetical protein [Paenibacillus sp. 481]UHA72678.1 hypothetical protein KIK04_18830 [Paenibacillus sp. 481]
MKVGAFMEALSLLILFWVMLRILPYFSNEEHTNGSTNGGSRMTTRSLFIACTAISFIAFMGAIHYSISLFHINNQASVYAYFLAPLVWLFAITCNPKKEQSEA